MGSCDDFLTAVLVAFAWESVESDYVVNRVVFWGNDGFCENKTHICS
jgi:hypothetical protein